MNQFRDSNEYETQYSQPDDPDFIHGVADDRDEQAPEFEVEDEFAYNLDVEPSPF